MKTLPLNVEPQEVRLKAGSREPVRVVVVNPSGGIPKDAEVKVVQGKLHSSEVLPGDKLALEVIPPKRSGHLGILVSATVGGAPVRYKTRLPVNTTVFGIVYEMLESIVLAVALVAVLKSLLFQPFYIPSASMEPTLYEGDRLVASPLPYFFREPERGEVIIFRAPKAASPHRNRDEIDLYIGEIPLPGFFTRSEYFEIGGKRLFKYPYRLKHRVDDFIKRVMAVEGDTLEVRDGFVYINNKKLKERVMIWDYIPAGKSRTRPTGKPTAGVTDYVIAERPRLDYGPVKVPKGHVFVMGDNRNNSHDSRFWGGGGAFLNKKLIVGKALFIFIPPPRIGKIP